MAAESRKNSTKLYERNGTNAKTCDREEYGDFLHNLHLQHAEDRRFYSDIKGDCDLLAEGRTPSNKPMRDVKEAEAHQKLFFEILENDADLSLEAILRWHRKVFKETKPNLAEKIRDYQVAIHGSSFIPPRPEALLLLLKDFFIWYNKNKRKLNPVELSAFVHLKFVTIHPFGDGNGRISRLMMNYVLNKLGYPMLDIDYRDRRSYYNALERTQRQQNDITFLQWLMRRYFKTHKRFLE